jgi:uncharacterized protein YjaG (DUF416 family)
VTGESECVFWILKKRNIYKGQYICAKAFGNTKTFSYSTIVGHHTTTMNFQEFTSMFKKQVDRISFERKLDLALSICKRLFFDYQKFYEENDWGNPDVLLDAINIIEKSKAGSYDQKHLKSILQRIDEVTPDSEDFGEANYAINASGAVYETLEFLLDRDESHIYNIGTYLIDTVDSRVQDDEDLSEDEIDQHPLMVDAKNYLLQETK